MARIATCLLVLASLAAAQDAIEAGRALLGGPDRAQGVAMIREGIEKLEKEPVSAAGLHRIGLGYFYLEDDAKAKVAFEGAARLEPRNARHVYMLGVMQKYSDLAAAALTMRKAIELDPEDPRFRVELGDILSSRKCGDEALACYLEACRLDPGNTRAHYQAACLLVDAGKDDEALAHYGRAVAADPRCVDAWYNTAQLHYNHGRFDRALEAWTKAAELAPDDFQTQTKLVQACYALGRYADAEPFRKRVLELRPKDRAEFCFDQFDLDGNRVFAYEAFDTSGDLYYRFTFKVTSPKGKILKTVNLESSAILREHGGMYILGADSPEGHATYAQGWTALPPYLELKALVVKAARGELDAGASSGKSPAEK